MKKGVLLVFTGIIGAAALYDYQRTQETKKTKKVKARKKKKKELFCIKDDYYRIGDSLWEWDDCLPKQDKKGRAIFENFIELSDDLYKHLNENYIWD